jgi:hemoglobin
MADLDNIDSIKLMVHTFYGKVRKDNLIGPIFEKVIEDRWPEHLEKLTRFWQTILLNEPMYFGRPFPPHMKLSIGAEHFEHWLSIFNANLDEHFSGPKTEEARLRAQSMAAMFTHKLNFLKNQPGGIQ